MEELVQSLNWFDGSEEELVRELLDNDSPFFLLPAAERTTNTDQCTSSISSSSEEPPEMISRPVSSNVYSGPTIGDVETALSLTNSSTTESTSTTNSIISRFGISILEKGLSKVDNKYTLKIKSCGDGMQDDGYKWRKYGQKSIKNSSNPRSYYRCTNPRCSAKKQVERSNEDPDMLIITYEGLHLHFTYSHFLPNQTHNAYPPMKKPKLSSSTSQNHDQLDKEEAQAAETLPAAEPSQKSAILTELQPDLFEGTGSQGLLEDMVPMMIRKPLPNTSTWSNSSCSSSYPSSPPTSSSSFSWSPNCSNDVGVISSTYI